VAVGGLDASGIWSKKPVLPFRHANALFGSINHQISRALNSQLPVKRFVKKFFGVFVHADDICLREFT
jgi:hypothetical protein